VQRLRELGWTEGRNIVIEVPWGEGRSERFAEIAAEFVRLKVDVIVSGGSAALAVKLATSVIPVVFAVAVDPVGSGLVSSLARPGSNLNRAVDGIDVSTSCERSSPVCGGWRLWPMQVIQQPWWR
jgi:putative ABC transport system substrate-binding protein